MKTLAGGSHAVIAQSCVARAAKGITPARKMKGLLDDREIEEAWAYASLCRAQINAKVLFIGSTRAFLHGHKR